MPGFWGGRSRESAKTCGTPAKPADPEIANPALSIRLTQISFLRISLKKRQQYCQFFKIFIIITTTVTDISVPWRAIACQKEPHVNVGGADRGAPGDQASSFDHWTV